jgi:uncharacterized C2H2 Zn-finger protein
MTHDNIQHPAYWPSGNPSLYYKSTDDHYRRHANPDPPNAPYTSGSTVEAFFDPSIQFQYASVPYDSVRTHFPSVSPVHIAAIASTSDPHLGNGSSSSSLTSDCGFPSFHDIHRDFIYESELGPSLSAGSLATNRPDLILKTEYTSTIQNGYTTDEPSSPSASSLSILIERNGSDRPPIPKKRLRLRKKMLLATNQHLQLQCPDCDHCFVKQRELNRHRDSVHGLKEAALLLNKEIEWWEAVALMEMASRKHCGNKNLKLILRTAIQAWRTNQDFDAKEYNGAFLKYARFLVDRSTCSSCLRLFSRPDAASRPHKCEIS